MTGAENREPIAPAGASGFKDEPLSSGRWNLSGLVFPSGVRLWHFIVLPAGSMGLVIALSRWLDPLLLESLTPVGADVYAVARAMVISVLMASVIAWLAFRHRREYEARIRARNVVLEATRDFLSRIIDGSGEAIITVDPEWNVTSWNRAAEEIYGWSAAEMLGQPVTRLFPTGTDVGLAMERTEDEIRAGRTVRDFESARVRRDGTTITVQVTRSPLYDANGEYAGSTGIVRDVTALKEMEKKLFERERLAAVGELSARVAHEVRNPLAGIRGACEILSEGYREGDPLQEIAGEVLRQVDRLNATVEDLLLFARPKPPNPISADVHEVLDHVIGHLADDPRTASATLDRRYDAGLPMLRLDPSQMEQVLLNVIQNALHATEFKGTVTVTTRRSGGMIEIAIRDDGPGIPRDVLANIFDPFFTTKTKGSGLGLAIVRNIVQAHGGSIRAASPEGGGAEFTLSLPAPAGPEASS